MGRTEGPDSAAARPNRDRDRDRRGPRSTQSRTVLISKALSRLLRHQAQNEGVPITSDGWVRLDHLFAWRGFSGRNGVTPAPTVDEIWEVVEENEKKRFAVRRVKDQSLQTKGASATELVDKIVELDVTAKDPHGQEARDKDENMTEDTLPPTEDDGAIAADSETNQAIGTWRSGLDTTPSHYLIRASQGHSMKAITSTSDLMRPVTLADPSSIPTTCVHGTFYGSWPLILRSGGLKPMGRNHVHFAPGPALSEILPHGIDDNSDSVAGEQVKIISGMRHDAQILIYVDLRRCLEDVQAKGAEMEWWRSENGVILTAGIDPALVGVVRDSGVTTTAAAAATEVQGADLGGLDARARLQTDVVMEVSAEPSTSTTSAAVEQATSGNQKQINHGHALQSRGLDVRLVPMKYWTVVVEVKKGLGVLWRQDSGVVRDLPPDLLARGTPKGQRGGGRGRRGAWRGR